jgi:hypothetical protein
VPKPMGALFAGNSQQFEFERTGAVPESAPGGHAKIAVIAVVDVKSNKTRMVLVVAEGAGDTVVTDQNLEERIGNP